MNKSKIYFSKKFFIGQPLSALPPEVELQALDQLRVSLLKQEKYETIVIVQNRIDEIRKKQKQQYSIIPWRCVNKDYMLN